MSKSLFAQNLKALIRARDTTQDAVARVAGVSKGTVSHWLNDGTIGEPKSKAGERALPLPPLLAQKVAQWRDVRDSSPLLRGAKTLCCDTRGGVLRPQNLYRWWEANKAAFGARAECPRSSTAPRSKRRRW